MPPVFVVCAMFMAGDSILYDASEQNMWHVTSFNIIKQQRQDGNA